ncbi:hypothetical protein [Halegenticoccus soli]|uniref:hypothetical protein n=1 Tax=Halegenticoccus soli TaxID=1985678 RepID=UPI000C6EAB68|nr:hypothetical protein [Halegenticoccus soli]
MNADAEPRDVHVSSVFVRAGFDAVWDRVADPLGFPELYPNWTSTVERDGDGTFRGTGPDGDEFTISPRLRREVGVVDFDVTDAEGNVERSRSRLFPVGDDCCVLVHLAIRRPGVSDDGWEEHTRGTDEDLERAKRLIESESAR